MNPRDSFVIKAEGMAAPLVAGMLTGKGFMLEGGYDFERNYIALYSDNTFQFVESPCGLKVMEVTHISQIEDLSPVYIPNKWYSVYWEGRRELAQYVSYSKKTGHLKFDNFINHNGDIIKINLKTPQAVAATSKQISEHKRRL